MGPREHVLLFFAFTWSLILIAPQPAPAQDVDKIEASVKKGIAYLKSASWHYQDRPPNPGDEIARQRDVGVAALVGMALIESDVPKNNDAVNKAIAIVREAAPTLTRTEPLSWAITFLRRYGASQDDRLIATLCLRLAAGQHPNGCWADDVPLLTPEVEKQWAAWFNARKGLIKFNALQNIGAPRKPHVAIPPDRTHSMRAMIALWVGRTKEPGRLHFALLRAAEPFRITQRPDGGWGWTSVDDSDVLPTCAGLIALALGRVADQERVGRRSQRDLEKLASTPEAVKARTYLEFCVREARIGSLLHFLPALERVCVVYDLDRHNWWDWYGWGVDILIKRQTPEGCWAGDEGEVVHTALALLFIRRTNLLTGLTMQRTGFRADNRPEPEPQEDPKELTKELLASEGAKFDAALAKLQNSKGAEYTSALAETIPQLKDAAQQQARDALMLRMARFTPKSLEDYWLDKDRELRLAAVRAVTGKNLTDRLMECLPSLIALLDDADQNVKDAAYVSLKEVTGQDHGRSASAWKRWWEKERKE